MFGTYSAIYFVLVVTSCIWPIELHDLIKTYLWPYIPVAIGESAQSNLEYLAAMGDGRFGLRFFSQRILGAALTVLLIAVLALQLLIDRATLFKLGTIAAGGIWPNLRPIVGLLIALFLLWWAFLSPDFFFVSDRDYSGLLRPGFGDIALFGNVFLGSLLLVTMSALLVRRVVFMVTSR